MKRYLSVVLIISLISFQLPFKINAATDIAGHWAEAYIEKWISKDVITGYPDGSYSPNANITRAEFFGIISKVMNLNKVGTERFTDVSVEAWYSNIISLVTGAGYVTGYGDGKIEPEKEITREEASVILSRIFKLDRLVGIPNSKFTDSTDVSPWAIGSLNSMSELHYITGYEDGSFKPTSKITRAEVIKIIDSMVSEDIKTKTDVEDKQFDGNLVLTVSDIALKNVKVNGDILVSGCVSSGEMRFENVNVTGRIIFNADKKATLILKDCQVNNLEIENTEGETSIVAFKDSKIKNTRIFSNTVLQDVERSNVIFESVSVEGSETTNLTLKSAVTKLFLEEKCNVVLDVSSVVNYAEIGDKAKDTSISAYSSIPLLKLNADVTINGEPVLRGSITRISQILPVISSNVGSGGGGGSGGGSSSGNSGIAIPTSVSLKSLVVKEANGIGAMKPDFTPSKTDYTVSVKNAIENIVIIPQVDNKWGEITIDGNIVENSTEHLVSLIVGENNIVIKLNLGLSEKAIYTIKVVRQIPADPIILDKINTDTENTTINDLLAIKLDSLVDNEIAAYRTALKNAIALKGGPITEIEMQLVINNENVKFASLSLISIKNTSVYVNNLELLRPSFQSSTFSYTASVDNYVSDVIINADGLNAESVVKIGNTIGKQITKNLNYGDNIVEISVTSANGLNTKAYTLNIHRDSDESNQISNSYFSDGASLYTLTALNSSKISDGWQQFDIKLPAPATRNFWDSILTQKLTIANDTQCILEFVAKTSDGTDKVIQLLQVDSGSTQRSIKNNGNAWKFDIKGSETLYTIPFKAVTLADKLMTLRFDLGVGDQSIQFKFIRLTIPSSDDTLKSIMLDQTGVYPTFNPSTLNYSAIVENNVNQVSINPAANFAGAAVSINSQSISAPYIGNLIEGDNIFNIEVTALAGNKKTYKLNIMKLSKNLLKNGKFSLTTENWLLSGGTLTKDATGVTISNLQTPNALLKQDHVTGITAGNKYMVNFIASSLGADKKITLGFLDDNGNLTKTTEVTVNGNIPKTYNALVEAPSGDATFAVNVGLDATEMRFEKMLLSETSSNANVNDIIVSRYPKGNSNSVMYPKFASVTNTYNADFESSIDKVGINVMAADSGALFTVNGVTSVSGSVIQLPLNVGDNTFNVTVTSSDQTVTKQYTINAKRDVSDGNLVQDYRFTGDLTSWGLRYASSPVGYNFNATLAMNDGWLRVKITNEAGPYVSTTVLYQDVVLQPSTTYTLSGLVKVIAEPDKISTIGGDREYMAMVSNQYAADPIDGTSRVYRKTNENGTSFTWTFTTPATLPIPTRIAIQCGGKVSGTLKDTRDLLIKNISLKKIN